jgi:arylsulfatase A-like enzyme
MVKWPAKVKPSATNNQTICTTDFFATCAEIVGQSFVDYAGEDSYSMMPLLAGKSENFKRKATVHHSVDGEFAIRKDNLKLILCPGSGGWSYPTKKDSIYSSLPAFQLFDLENDPGEENNLIYEMPEKADELQTLLLQIIENGRSTEGEFQKNDGPAKWAQLDFMD